MNSEEFNQELELIKRNPYNYIRDFYEVLYPNMGRRVMSILCLLPCSLIVPALTDSHGKMIMPRLSMLLLSPPGTAKSALSANFKKFAYEPFAFESITDSKLDFVMAYKKRATLITSDIMRIFADRDLVKALENIIGDEGCISRLNRNTGDEAQKIEAVAYMAGTPENLTRSIQDGLIFRTYPLIIYHTEREHLEILQKVNQEIGRGIPKEFMDKENVIVEYYRLLLDIQDEHKNTEIKRIEGYYIPEEFREIIANELIPLFSKPFKDTNFEFVRELIRCYRIMVSHAFLNVYTRQKIAEGGKNKIVITKEDLDIAINLSKEEIKTKTIILNSMNRVSERKFRTTNELKEWAIEQNKIGQKVDFNEYKTMQILIQSR